MKKLHVDDHVHLQHQELQAAYRQQQVMRRLLPSLVLLTLRLHAYVQPLQSWPCSRSAWTHLSCAEIRNELGETNKCFFSHRVANGGHFDTNQLKSLTVVTDD